MGRDYYIKKEGVNLKNLINSIFKKNVPKFPDTVLLETQSGCNGMCVFCPYESIEKILPKGRMKDELFLKIVDEISYFKIKKIIPCFINEPLLDASLIDKLDYIREKAPETRISLTTNASLLTKDKIRRILKEGSVDEFNISFQGISRETYETSMKGLNYEKTLENVKTLLRLRETSIKRPTVTITTVETNIVEQELKKAKDFWGRLGAYFKTLAFETRSGDVSQKLKMKSKRISFMNCKRPFNTMVISFDGKVPICCVDYTRRIVLGDTNKEQLYDIWHGPSFFGVRKKLIEGKGFEIPACRDCRMAE